MDGPKDWHSVRRFNNFAEVAVWLATVVGTTEQASSASGVLDVVWSGTGAESARQKPHTFDRNQANSCETLRSVISQKSLVLSTIGH
jgi:hypothetical protein